MDFFFSWRSLLLDRKRMTIIEEEDDQVRENEKKKNDNDFSIQTK